MENESIGQRGIGINFKGSQGQTERDVALQEDDDDDDDEGEIKLIIWSQILAVKAQWLLCVQPALIQMAVFACTVYLRLSYGCQRSDCSLLVRGP